jgi:hypothetical protein
VQMHDERRTWHHATDNRQRARRETGDGDDDKKPCHAGMEVTLQEGSPCGSNRPRCASKHLKSWEIKEMARPERFELPTLRFEA